MGELKAGWRRVKFGEVVRQVKDRVDPETAGLERFVAGEHMETDDLRIRRWGEIGDGYLGPAFHMRFRPGQVLYGSRRTYLRKVAMADFEGICANTTFVLESADPSVLLPELLPFVMSTEAFHEHSKRESKGSVNPYVNFSDLGWYEFALPPLEEQRRIAILLTGANRAKEATASLVSEAALCEMAELQDHFKFRHLWPHRRMDQCGDVQLGQQKHPSFENGDCMRPFLRVANIQDGYLLLDEIQSMNFPGSAFAKHRLQAGDLLVTEGDLIGPRTVGRCAMFRGEIENCCIQKTLLRFRPGAGMLPGYALWAFRHLRYAGVFAKAATGSTVAHLVAVKFRAIDMPIAPASVQQEIASAADRWHELRPRLQHRAARADELYRLTANSALSASAR